MRKQQVSLPNRPSELFEIALDEAVGYYVYRYVEGRCTPDYLQDTLDQTKYCAFDEFGVPIDAWTIRSEK
jgi:hypothetical protein